MKLPFLNTILFPGLPKPIHVKQVFEGQAGLLAGTDLRISSPYSAHYSLKKGFKERERDWTPAGDRTYGVFF